MPAKNLRGSEFIFPMHSMGMTVKIQWRNRPPPGLSNCGSCRPKNEENGMMRCHAMACFTFAVVYVTKTRDPNVDKPVAASSPLVDPKTC